MNTVNLFLVSFALILLHMHLAFFLSQLTRRVSIVDVFWGLGFVVAAIGSFVLSGNSHPRQVLVVFLVLLWGVRLALYIAIRSLGKGEDRRYQALKEKWGNQLTLKTYVYVFLLQALLLMIIATPVIYINAVSGLGFTILDVAGSILWLIGFSFESIADIQLFLFKSKPENKGKVMNTGLWYYSRHPNYFGESLVWFGIWIIGLNLVGGWIFIFSPILITFLLVRVSGAKIIESNHKDDPDYQHYIKTTSGFVPWVKKG